MTLLTTHLQNRHECEQSRETIIESFFLVCGLLRGTRDETLATENVARVASPPYGLVAGTTRNTSCFARITRGQARARERKRVPERGTSRRDNRYQLSERQREKLALYRLISTRGQQRR